jgi:hypothetical protein
MVRSVRQSRARTSPPTLKIVASKSSTWRADPHAPTSAVCGARARGESVVRAIDA